MLAPLPNVEGSGSVEPGGLEDQGAMGPWGPCGAQIEAKPSSSDNFVIVTRVMVGHSYQMLKD